VVVERHRKPHWFDGTIGGTYRLQDVLQFVPFRGIPRRKNVGSSPGNTTCEIVQVVAAAAAVLRRLRCVSPGGDAS
jgi:hypothetical protein